MKTPCKPDGSTDARREALAGAPGKLRPAAPVPARARVRSPLAETLRSLAGGARLFQRAPSAAPPALPEGAQFLSLTHSGAKGACNYRLYLPSRRRKGPMPLIVMLHGCTQTPEDFAVGTRMNRLAERHRCLIAYPAQALVANTHRCWNWYRPENQARGKGEPALIASLTREILRNHPVDPARIYVAGLSAGAAAAIVLARAYPELFSAVGVHSGVPAGGARDVPSAFAAMRDGAGGRPHRSVLPTIVFHGLADSKVHPDNGTAILRQATSCMPDLEIVVRNSTARGGRACRTTAHVEASGRSLAELWEIEGGGHAWSGGDPAGSHTDASGPDASRQMLRFFLQHRKA